ncbi:putative QWRF family protein [Dioscorea sansibarensis]
MKLDVILTEQLAYLEDWAALEKGHSSSLSAAIEALKASTLRLPVSGGAKVDVRAIKNAISSAVDTMQKISSSVCYSLSKVVNMNRLATELSDAAMIEMIMLDEYGDLLASAAALQMKEFSLRTHLMQLRLENVHKMR